MRFICFASFVALASAGCSTPTQPPTPKSKCTIKDQSGCSSDQTCEAVMGGQPACFDPVIATGTVTDVATHKPIANARVLALDIVTGAAFSDVALSNVDGSYHLVVPAQRSSVEHPDPTPLTFTIRVEAPGYAPFASPPRFASVIDVKDAKGPPYVIQTASTDIALLHLKNTMGFGSITGSVSADDPAGALVVASGATGMADRRGNYVVFDVPPGNAKVQAFKQGKNFDIATATVMPDQQVKNVVLSSNMTPAVAVSGNVQISNPGSATTTSVSLFLESTFDATLNRGVEVPGLQSGQVSGAFSITGVPDGQYVVLPAFQNDGLVRAPDTSVTGAPIVHITVSGGDQALTQTLKVTGAMAVLGLGATGLDSVTGTPTFAWQADPNADSYRVELFDAFGASIWTKVGNFASAAGQPESLPYAGPTLQNGMIYQFRATSLKSGTPESSTEDLLGAFLYQ